MSTILKINKKKRNRKKIKEGKIRIGRYYLYT